MEALLVPRAPAVLRSKRLAAVDARQLIEVSYHEWKSLARRRATEASVVWVRDTQAGAEGNRKDSDYEKLLALPESDSVKLI